MLSYTYGVLPPREVFDAQYVEHMQGKTSYDIGNPTEEEWEALTALTGYIDAHLEAVDFEQYSDSRGRPSIRIKGAGSLYTLIRRAIEKDDDTALNLMSSILGTLGIEWV